MSCVQRSCTASAGLTSGNTICNVGVVRELADLPDNSFFHEIYRVSGDMLMTKRKRRKWSLRWSVPAVLALSIGSGYWGLVGGCGPADTEPCDDKSCPSGEVCLGDGLCCGSENACGSACCDDLDSCIESLSLCCGFDEPTCGTQCCESGESCIDGTSCCPTDRVCGSVCCPEGNGCDHDTNTCSACPNPTDNPCNVGGCCPTGMLCQDIEGICCQQGELYCFGACRPLNECNP